MKKFNNYLKMSKFKHYMEMVQNINESDDHNFQIDAINVLINNKTINLYDNGKFTKLKYSDPEELTEELKKLINYNLTIKGMNKEDIIEKIKKDENFKNNLESIMNEFINLYDSAAHGSDEKISSGSHSLTIEIDITQGQELDMEFIKIKLSDSEWDELEIE